MRFLKNDKGFTLVEMLVVLFIIAVLILVTIPNVTKHFSTVDKKGCDAYVAMVQGQMQAYKLHEQKYPESLEALRDAGYLSNTEKIQCPDGRALVIENGVVKLAKNSDNKGTNLTDSNE